MDIIVSDASPLIFLAKLDLLPLLAETAPLFVPREVFAETTAKPDLPDAVLIRRLAMGKAVILAPGRAPALAVAPASAGLGAGEIAALGWAVKKNALLAADDLAALRLASVLGVSWTTTPALIVFLCDKGLLKREEAVLKMEALSGMIWMKDELMDRYKAILQGRGSHGSRRPSG